MNTNELILQAADRLFAAQRDKQPCAPIRDLIGETDQKAAYEVHHFNVSRRLETGERLIGRKVALSSRVVQQQMGVDSPTYGSLFANMCLPEGADVACCELMQPRIETEIAVVLAKPLTQPDTTLVDILDAVAYVVPAFEIVGSRLTNWDVRCTDFIADNSAASHFIVGASPRKLSEIDIVRCKMVTRRGDEVVSSGSGASCYGNPLHALQWMARKLVQAGQPLQAGEIILTGSLGPMVPVAQGDRFTAQIEGLGEIRANFV